jgi:hypothetical protein
VLLRGGGERSERGIASYQSDAGRVVNCEAGDDAIEAAQFWQRIDSGKTEFHGVPIRTCLAIGLDDAEKIDEITGSLQLF